MELLYLFQQYLYLGYQYSILHWHLHFLFLVAQDGLLGNNSAIGLSSRDPQKLYSYLTFLTFNISNPSHMLHYENYLKRNPHWKLLSAMDLNWNPNQDRLSSSGHKNKEHKNKRKHCKHDYKSPFQTVSDKEIKQHPLHIHKHRERERGREINKTKTKSLARATECISGRNRTRK